MASYREIPRLIENRTAFKGNSLSGRPVNRGSELIDRGRGNLVIPSSADYVIWSYATPIGFAIGARLFVTSEKFSVTTSRGQNLLKTMGADEIPPDLFAKATHETITRYRYSSPETIGHTSYSDALAYAQNRVEVNGAGNVSVQINRIEDGQARWIETIGGIR